MTERIDDLQCNGYRIIQEEKGFCFGMDAVLLANFAVPFVNKETKFLDLGTGTGIIPLLIAAKTEAENIAGIELQAEVAGMAERSVRLNHAEERIRIIAGDIREIRSMGMGSSVNVVTANPPYMKTGLQSTENRKLISRHEVTGIFRDFAEAAAFVLKSNGRFFLVHRPNRLPEIMAELGRVHLEPKRLRMVYPYLGSEANLFLLEAVKGGKSQLTVEKPLIVYQEQNQYTQEIYEIYGMNDTV